jgi:hypothetical protein
MNEVFDNSRNAFLLAYDWGGVLVWQYRDWTFSGIGMNVGENANGNNYTFHAAEADCHIATALDEGNYRVMVSGTSKVNLDPSGKNLVPRFRVQTVLRPAPDSIPCGGCVRQHHKVSVSAYINPDPENGGSP